MTPIMTPVVLRRWQVVCAFLLLGVVATTVAFWNNHRINHAEERINRNAEIAIAAQVKAARADELVSNFKLRLEAEKVCSESNRGDACRALFQRLAEDLSAQQRRDLACSVAKELQLPQYQAFCS